MEKKEILDYVEKNSHEISDTVLAILQEHLPEDSNQNMSQRLALRIQDLKTDESKKNTSFEGVLKINESVRKLLSSFSNLDGRKSIHARSELKKRFPFLDYAEQVKIIDAFVKKGKDIDVRWVASYLIHDVYWKDDYLDTVVKVWKQEYDNWYLTKLVALRASSSCLRDFLRIYSSQRVENKRFRYDLLAGRLAAEDSSFVIDKSQLSPMQYVFCCAKAKRSISHEEAAAGFYSCILTSFNQLGWNFYTIESAIWNMKKVTYFFNCLQSWGMIQEIIEFNDWILRISRVVKQKMYQWQGMDDRSEYEKYIHQVLVPCYSPEKYGVLSLSPYEYRTFVNSFEEWKKTYHRFVVYYLIDKSLVSETDLENRRKNVSWEITEPYVQCLEDGSGISGMSISDSEEWSLNDFSSCVDYVPF
ncbi:MAG: hypothetical protein MJ198_08800 [Bacteroidales bacterium]|nr:hypothetical protein [Bacteroidales bacterium]